MRVLLFFFFMTLISPIQANLQADFILSALTVGTIKYLYMEEKAYLEHPSANHSFAPLAQYPKKLHNFSLDQFNHAQLQTWYEQLHHGHEVNISYEEIKQKPFTFIFAIYLLTGIVHIEEADSLNLPILRKSIDNDALARQFLDHQEAIGALVTEYFEQHVFPLMSSLGGQ